MRWDELFADLEAQLAAQESAELALEVADRTRREAAGLALLDRARAACGARITARVLGVGAVDGILAEVGSQWLLLAEPAGQEALVPLPALLSIHGLSPHTASPGSGGRVFERLGLGSALRGIARDRTPVALWLLDGSVLTGTIDRVGADFVELSLHPAGEAGRPSAGTGVQTVAMSALAVVRRSG